jgi:hypothetical protein
MYSRLNGHVVVPCSLEEWQAVVLTSNTRVALTVEGGVRVSTIFTGVGLLPFETAVFGGKFAGRERRYATWDEAEAGHYRLVAECGFDEEWPEDFG